MGLEQTREALNQAMAQGNWSDRVKANWPEVDGIIEAWRNDLKVWEAGETFARAYQDNRMSVRTFSTSFSKEKNKKIDDLQIVGRDRFRPDSSYKDKFPSDTQGDLSRKFHEAKEHSWYHADRGMDSSAFANSSNFATREAKYKAGLHDQSASLVNKDLSLFDQIHHQDDGALFSFLPLPDEGEQALLYALIRSAKALRGESTDLYTKVRELRSCITRVKLAAEYDLGVGYSAIPVGAPTLGKPAFKLRYGLGDVTKPVEGEVADAKATAFSTELTMKKVDKDTYEARQQAGIHYKSILARAMRRVDGHKNEIVVAIRHHAGPFPMYAIRRGSVLKVVDISGKAPVETGKTISDRGAVT